MFELRFRLLNRRPALRRLHLPDAVSQSQILLNFCFYLRLRSLIFALLHQILRQVPVLLQNAL